MKRKALGITLILALLFSAVAGALFVGLTSAQSVENITINNDGSVTPSSAPIIRNGNVYTLNRTIYGSITIEKSYVIFDGAGYAIDSSSSFAALTVKPETPIDEHVLGVTVKNLVVAHGVRGIRLQDANNSLIANNTISNVEYGIMVDIYGSGNIMAGNNVTNSQNGVSVWTSDNIIVGNHITACSKGIWFVDWAGNTVTGNQIADNLIAIQCWTGNPVPEGLANLIYYNNFINNTGNFLNEAVFKPNSTELMYSAMVNVWDDGALGNYWSDYNGTDSDSNGIGDTPYFVNNPYPLDANDTDHYPLMNPIEIAVPSTPIPTPTPTPPPTAPPNATPSPTTVPSSPQPTPTPELPELPSWIILPLLMAVVFGAVLLNYFKKHKRQT
jgi:parallel beta-helix repeat protein